ncbi:hypothetical protein BJ508DRAFT_152566 [Ascobolus immersus RN42]|uniref:BTB domain-containing protein n=1 Tax=Ascobolus immersus RN42 TaxID=1160509 RepID=A0A3N4IAI4_ASCIM|nr:hypothetical protein BJ508DRAFT_152566 [Ascobolus immersus RN42]
MESPKKRQRLNPEPTTTEYSDNWFQPVLWDTEDEPAPPPNPSGQYNVKPELAEHVYDVAKKLFLTDEYSDFTVVVGNRRYPGHQNIVCQQSQWFADALKVSSLHSFPAPQVLDFRASRYQL